MLPDSSTNDVCSLTASYSILQICRVRLKFTLGKRKRRKCANVQKVVRPKQHVSRKDASHCSENRPPDYVLSLPKASRKKLKFRCACITPEAGDALSQKHVSRDQKKRKERRKESSFLLKTSRRSTFGQAWDSLNACAGVCSMPSTFYS